MKKTIKVVRYLGYGYLVAEGKKAYSFEYEVEKDEGLGVLVPQYPERSNEPDCYTIVEVKYDKNGDPKEVIVKDETQLKEAI